MGYRRPTILTWCAILLLLTTIIPASGTSRAREQKTLRVALRDDPTTLNPDLRLDDNAFNLAQNIYNKLITLDIDYRIIPDLATSWEIAPDGLTYTFHLAHDVKWHDGTPFSSADVQWTLQQIRSAGVVQQDLTSIDRIDTPDAYTVILHLSEPFAPMLAILAWYGTYILPRHLYDGTDWTTNPANDAPIGTGPFRFQEWVKGDHLTLRANPDYFRDGPFVDEIVYQHFSDYEAIEQALSYGTIQYTLMPVPFKSLDELASLPGVQVSYP